MKKLLVILCLLLSGCLYKTHHIGDAAVKITNFSERSGGTGVVLSSSNTGSTILTNGHVCDVVKKGGLVIDSNDAKHIISGYIKSKEHDLCLVDIKANLGINTKVASKAPELYEDASIAGHPALLPIVITKGHFSKKLIIPIAIDSRECTKEDFDNPDTALPCLFMGSLPIVKVLETMLVTATIMPGSSGSAVYNSKDELVGLVFAGRGELGYAIIVPFEHLKNFLEVEHLQLEMQVPKNTL